MRLFLFQQEHLGEGRGGFFYFLPVCDLQSSAARRQISACFSNKYMPTGYFKSLHVRPLPPRAFYPPQFFIRSSIHPSSSGRCLGLVALYVRNCSTEVFSHLRWDYEQARRYYCCDVFVVGQIDPRVQAEMARRRVSERLRT